MQADLHAGADRGQRRRLGEDFRVRADADLEVLRPQALRKQHRLEPVGFGRAGADAREVVAHHGHHLAAHRLGTARVAARLLLDHALDHAGRKGHAGRLDHLQVVRSEQMAMGDIRSVCGGLGQPVGQRTEGTPRCALHGPHRIRAIEQRRHRGRQRADVEQLPVAHRHQRGPAAGAGHPHTADQQRAVGVVRQRRRHAQGVLPGLHLSAP
ncbi:hypothetical protein D9M72_323650 [compost metagenome]